MLRTLIQQSVDAFLQQSGGGIQIRPAATGRGWDGVANAQLNRHQARPAAPAAQGAVAVADGHRQQRGSRASRKQGRSGEWVVDPAVALSGAVQENAGGPALLEPCRRGSNRFAIAGTTPDGVGTTARITRPSSGMLNSSALAMKATGRPRAWPSKGGSRCEPWLATTTRGPCMGTRLLPAVDPRNSKRKTGNTSRLLTSR